MEIIFKFQDFYQKIETGDRDGHVRWRNMDRDYHFVLAEDPTKHSSLDFSHPVQGNAVWQRFLVVNYFDFSRRWSVGDSVEPRGSSVNVITFLRKLESGQLLFMGPITVHHVDRRPAVNITTWQKEVSDGNCTWRYHGILLY